MKYIFRALKDTCEGQAKALFVLVVGGGLALLYLYFAEGRHVAVEEVPYFWGAIFGAFGALALLFVWNLFCSPFRIERDAHLKTIAERDRLLENAPPPGRLLTQQQQQLLTGTLRESGVTPEKINVVHFPSEECTDFASTIGDAVMDAGISCDVHDGGFYTKKPKDRGIKLYRGRSKSLESLACQIAAQFGEFGFPVELRRTNGENNIFFYVARSD